MNIPADLLYTQNDEWIKVDGVHGTIGITNYAQEQLSDVVFVEVLAGVGDKLKKGEACATVESVKAAADVYAPLSGDVIEVNETLPDTPELVNRDAYGAAWLLKIHISEVGELAGLLDATAYLKHCQDRQH